MAIEEEIKQKSGLTMAIDESKHEDNDDNHVSALCASSCYPDIIQKFEELLKDDEVPSSCGVELAGKVEYQLIFDCIQLMVKIEDSLYILYAFIRDNYGRNIPEVESLVAHPVDFVRAVKDAGFEIVDGACDQVLDLVSLRKRLLDFVDNRMVYIAPNLSAIVGATVAAKLMVAAGGLELLGKMTACNVQLLGSQRRNLDGLSTRLHFGCLQESDILQTFPSALTIGASSVLASACSTAARVDSMGNDLTGNTGKNLREVVVNKINRYCNAGREHSDLRTNIAEGAPDSKALAGLS